LRFTGDEAEIGRTMSFDDLPMADPEREKLALDRFRLDMSPDEYAARFGHEFALFSFDEYRYAKPGLTEWVQRLGDIFFGRNGAPTLGELRKRYLSSAEIAAAEARARDPL
jgi:hypothetical protein